jgi:hypothetical protein
VSQEAQLEVPSAPEAAQKEFAVAVVSHTLEQLGLMSGRESEQVQIQEQGSSVVSAEEPSMQNTMSALQKQESPWSALAPQYQLLNCSLQCKRDRLSD